MQWLKISLQTQIVTIKKLSDFIETLKRYKIEILREKENMFVVTIEFNTNITYIFFSNMEIMTWNKSDKSLFYLETSLRTFYIPNAQGTVNVADCSSNVAFWILYSSFLSKLVWPKMFFCDCNVVDIPWMWIAWTFFLEKKYNLLNISNNQVNKNCCGNVFYLSFLETVFSQYLRYKHHIF